MGFGQKSLVCVLLGPRFGIDSLFQLTCATSTPQLIYAIATFDKETRGLEKKGDDDNAQKEFECQNLNFEVPVSALLRSVHLPQKFSGTNRNPCARKLLEKQFQASVLGRSKNSEQQ